MRGSLVVALCATLTACEPAREQPPPAADSAVTTTGAAPVAQNRFYPARPLADLPQPAMAAMELTKARAEGIAFSTFDGPTPSELAILNDTAHEVATVARVRFYPLTDGGFTDTIWVRQPNLFSELERASHEDYGLQAALRRGAWARVNYAYDSAGVARQGWVRIVAGRVSYVSYDSLMLKSITSFADTAEVRFFDRPGGNEVQISLAPSYSLDVIQPQRDWVRVVLTVPDTTACTGDENAKVDRRDTVWVPRVNANGRRQLLPAVAGC